MESYEPLNAQDLYNQFTPETQVKEGTAKVTVPSGEYILQADRYEARIAPSDHFRWPGRKLYSLNGPLSKGEQTFGRIFVDMSAEVDGYRAKNGRMDGPASLWTHLIAALDAQGKSDGDVLDTAKRYPLEVYVKETFDVGEHIVNPKDRWLSAKTPEERVDFFTKGYTASNRVTSIRKVK